MSQMINKLGELAHTAAAKEWQEKRKEHFKQIEAKQRADFAKKGVKGLGPIRF